MQLALVERGDASFPRSAFTERLVDAQICAGVLAKMFCLILAKICAHVRLAVFIFIKTGLIGGIN